MLRLSVIPFAAAGAFAAAMLNCSDPSEPQRAAESSLAQSGKSSVTVELQHSGTSNRLQAISPVNERWRGRAVTGGTYVVTTNGGRTWKVGVVPGAVSLEFRDVQAFSANRAYLLSAGPGPASRIYKTEDGGAHWTLQFKNGNPKAFYDCFAFWKPWRGITMSDAVDGRFPVIRVTNGTNWDNIATKLPAAQTGEAAFAASGTCVATEGEDNAWIATGGAAKARILATTDGGDTWKAYNTPIVQGTGASGGVSVALPRPASRDSRWRQPGDHRRLHQERRPQQRRRKELASRQTPDVHRVDLWFGLRKWNRKERRGHGTRGCVVDCR